MTNLAPPSATNLNFNPDDHPDLQVRSEVYTVNNMGKWRQYDGPILPSPSLLFTSVLALSIRTNTKNDQFLRLDLACQNRMFSIENRCGPNDKGLLPTRAHSLMEALLGLHAANGTLADCMGYFTACLGSRPGPAGSPGVFINVTDMTSGKPTRVPKKLLDRDLSTGEFHSAQQMLQAAIRSF